MQYMIMSLNGIIRYEESFLMLNNYKNFNELSYGQHEALFSVKAEGEDHLKRIFDATTMAAWRHEQLCSVLNPIFESEPGAKWLTTGDGRWGLDAWFIQNKGCDVVATDISDSRLKEACEYGFIKEFKKENAESLSFGDGTFDYILCKASYHHFPRPMIALYEMLRVASKGVVLIEPVDRYITGNFLEVLFRILINDVFHIEKKHQFEKVAKNYVYTVSEREIEKVALGMNYPAVAFKGINLSALQGSGQEKFSTNSKLYKKFKYKMLLLDVLAWLRLRKHGKLVSVIFKEIPSPSLVTKLKKCGFQFKYLPGNPHI